MKILHLIDSGGLYGAEKMLLALVTEQLRQGLQPMILSAGEPGCPEKALELEAVKQGLPVTPWRMRPGLNPGESRRLLHWAREQGYPLLHSHGYKFNILLNLPFLRRGSPSFVTTVHGYTATRGLSKLGLYRFLDRWFLQLAEGVAVVSDSLQRHFRGHRYLRLIPNGISTEREPSYYGKAATPLPEDYFLALGRLSPEKALDRLVRAFAQLKTGPDVPCSRLKLVIAGDGPEREALNKLVAQLGLEDSVLFYGFVQAPSRLIHNARALVISSVTEGLPLTLLEAMRENTPVIATPVGEIPAVLEHGRLGLLARSLRWQDLADAMETSLRQPGLAEKKAQLAEGCFYQQYTAAAMEARYRAFYQGVLHAD